MPYGCLRLSAHFNVYERVRGGKGRDVNDRVSRGRGGQRRERRPPVPVRSVGGSGRLELRPGDDGVACTRVAWSGALHVELGREEASSVALATHTCIDGCMACGDGLGVAIP